MADVSLTDPLGRIIVLHDQTWYRHIVRGHPEMAADRPLVEQAVRHPDEIRQAIQTRIVEFTMVPAPARRLK